MIRSLDLIKLQNTNAPHFKMIPLGKKKKRFHLPKSVPKKGHQMSCCIFLNTLGLA